MKPVRLTPRFVERVWGTTELSPWFPNPAATIGEVWYTADDNETSEGISLRSLMEREGANLLGSAVRPVFGGRFPILVKLLFTREKLSVQVHPDDVYGHANEGSPGKTEMWFVLHAEDKATIGAGFRETIAPEALRAAVGDGSLEEQVKWWPAVAGETFFVPAGTVHAVGAGVVICEIQQNSDVTYRLWDYGRPRELHVDKSLAVAGLGRHPGPQERVPIEDGETLACCAYFTTERLRLDEPRDFRPDPERFHLLVATAGCGTLTAGKERLPFRQGECILMPAQSGPYRLEGNDLEVLRVYVPA